MIFKTLVKIGSLLLIGSSLTACLDSSTLGGNASATSSYTGCLNGKGVTNSSIKVNFDFPSGYDRVVISRDGVEVSQSQSSSVTSFTDTGLVEGMTYRYTCDAYIGARKTSGATYLDLSPVNTNAPTFSGITDAQVTNAHAVSVTWAPESTTGAQASYYQIFATVGNTVVWSSSLKKTVTSDGEFSASVPGLGDELPYSFGVRACTKDDICDTNTVMKTVMTPDGGAALSEGITAVSAANMTAYLTAPWKDSDGAISERRIFVCTGAACTFPTTATKVYAVSTTSLANPPTQLTVENLSENTTYFFKVVDVDPSGNINSTTQSISMVTGDLTAPLFGGITNAAVVDPKDKTVGLSFIALSREGMDVSIGDASGTTDYLLYQTAAAFPSTPVDACTLATPTATLSASTFPPGVASYNVTNLTQRTNYSFCLRARDKAGNISSNSTSSAVTTWDITAPVFGGVQSVTFDSSTKLVNVTWNGSNSTDLRNYVIKLWKNTANPSAGQITTFNASSTVTSKTFSTSDFAFVGNDVVYALVDACDNTADLGLGLPDNCTANAVSSAKYASIPDITPPQNFRGIASSGSLSSTAEGTATIAWLAPTAGYDSDYQGFKIYSVDPSSEALTLLTTCVCASPGHCSTSVIQDNQCTVSGLNPGRVYRFHVRAYDAAGNLTTYLDPTVNYADLRIKDATAPTFISNLSVSAMSLTWNAATDNQYAGSDTLNNPANIIKYQIYRKSSSTFTSATNPATDGTLVTTQTATSYTDSTLTVAGNYYYTICAIDSQNNSKCDGVVKSMSVSDVIPPTIASFTSSDKSKTDTLRKVWSLTWSVSDNISAAANVRVRIYKKSGDTTVLASTSDTKIFDGYASTTSLTSLSGDINVNTNIDYLLWVQDEAGNVTTAHYRVISNNLLKVTTVTSNVGVVGKSATIVIYGSGFVTSSQSGSGMTAITIGGVACSNFNIVSSDYIYCNVPSTVSTPGSYTINVTNPDGSSDTSQTFTYLTSGTGTGTCLDSTLSGATATGSGSVSNPYFVCNSTQLAAIYNSAAWASGVYIKMGANIDWGGGTNVPSQSFYGTIDGQGYALINDSINFTGSGYGTGVDLTIFKLKNTAGTTTTFKNIKMLRFGQTTGTLTGNGFAWGCTLCAVFPTVTATLVLDNFTYIGSMTTPASVDSGCGIFYAGLIGTVAGGNVQVKNGSDIRMTMTANGNCGNTNNYVGALIGYASGGASVSVVNSSITLTGTYTGTSAQTGAVMGYNAGSSVSLSSLSATYKFTRSGSGTGANGGFIGLLGTSSNIQISNSRSQFTPGDTSGSDGGFVGIINGTGVVFSAQDSYAMSTYSTTPTRGLFVATANSTAATGSSFTLNRVWSDIYWAVGGTANLTPTLSGFDTVSGSGVIYNTDDIYGITPGSVAISGDLRTNLQTQGSSNLFVTNGYDFTATTGTWKWCSGVTAYPKLQWESCSQ